MGELQFRSIGDYPLLAAEWHPTKNGSLRPEDVSVGSHRKVWWQCSAQHEWEAVVKSRVGGCVCPVCAGKTVLPGVNDFASLYPALLEEWDPERNAPLKPEGLSPGSHRRVWWRCQLGHRWQAPVSRRTGQGSGCYFCNGNVNRKKMEYYDRLVRETRLALEKAP